MFLRAKETFSYACIDARKGQLFETDDERAKQIVCEGLAVPVTLERAVAEMAGERAVEPGPSAPTKRTRKRGSNAVANPNAGDRSAVDTF